MFFLSMKLKGVLWSCFVGGGEVKDKQQKSYFLFIVKNVFTLKNSYVTILILETLQKKNYFYILMLGNTYRLNLILNLTPEKKLSF